MPEMKIERIVSVSSEDKKYPASNLLGPPGSGRWKSGSPGEKNVTVILQFTEPSKISSVHVGNEGSAFVEVLVGKASASSDQDWKVSTTILLARLSFRFQVCFFFCLAFSVI